MAETDPDPEVVKKIREMGRLRWDAWVNIAARPEQVPHPTKQNHLYIAGRGTGKTRSGAEWLAHMACEDPGRYALVVPTLDHGITECLEENFYKIIPAAWRHWRGSVNQLDLINGSSIKLYHAERPGKIRGPNLKGKWVDEPAEMRFGMDAWRNAQMATRINRSNGLPPQTFVTGTPKRVELMILLYKLAQERPHAYEQSTGRMQDNIANLSADVVEELISLYEGTNLGMQELDGIMLEDVEGALLTSDQIKKHRQDHPSSSATIVALSIDPGFSSDPRADEVGMVVGQKVGTGNSSIAEVIDDFSRHYGEGWGDLIVDKCIEHGVSVIVYEGNMVGQWVREALDEAFKSRGVKRPRIESVISKKSKWARAEPVAALAQKGRYRMIGTFAKLEAELTAWVPDTRQRSPNRLDAWAQLGRFFLIKHKGAGGVGSKPKGRVPSIG